MTEKRMRRRLPVLWSAGLMIAVVVGAATGSTALLRAVGTETAAKRASETATNGHIRGAVQPASARTQVSADQPELSTELRAICRPGANQIVTTQVQASPAGVPIVIENPEGVDGAFHVTLLGRDDGRFDTFTKGLDAGTNRVLFTLPPGPAYVGCFLGETFDAENVVAKELTEVVIVDSAGVWMSDRLACADPPAIGGFRDEAGLISPTASTPEETVREFVPGVLHSDRVVVGEYPDYEKRATVLVVREGETLAKIEVVIHGDLAHVFFGYACPGSGIGSA